MCCWIVLGLLLIVLGGKYEDIFLAFGHGQDVAPNCMCLLIGKFVYVNLGRSVWKGVKMPHMAKPGHTKKIGHVWSEWVGWHSAQVT